MIPVGTPISKWNKEKKNGRMVPNCVPKNEAVECMHNQA